MYYLYKYIHNKFNKYLNSLFGNVFYEKIYKVTKLIRVKANLQK
jgi:hypothetical protein